MARLPGGPAWASGARSGRRPVPGNGVRHARRRRSDHRRRSSSARSPPTPSPRARPVSSPTRCSSGSICGSDSRRAGSRPRRAPLEPRHGGGREPALCARRALLPARGAEASARPTISRPPSTPTPSSSAGRTSPPRSARSADAARRRPLQSGADRRAEAPTATRSWSPRASTSDRLRASRHRPAGRARPCGRAVRSTNSCPPPDIAIRGLRNRYRQAGLGAPLVARLAPVEDVAVRDRFIRAQAQGPGHGLPASRSRAGGYSARASCGERSRSTRRIRPPDHRSKAARFPWSSSRARRSPTRWTMHPSGTPRSGPSSRELPEGGWALYALSPVPPGTRAGRPVPRDGLQPRALGRSRQRARGGSADRAARAVLALHLQHGPPHPLFRRPPPRDADEEPWRSWTPRARTRRCGAWS